MRRCEHCQVAIRFGLDDPAETGQFYGMLASGGIRVVPLAVLFVLALS